jgi:hypothetical protein
MQQNFDPKFNRRGDLIQVIDCKIQCLSPLLIKTACIFDPGSSQADKFQKLIIWEYLLPLEHSVRNQALLAHCASREPYFHSH